MCRTEIADSCHQQKCAGCCTLTSESAAYKLRDICAHKPTRSLNSFCPSVLPACYEWCTRLSDVRAGCSSAPCNAICSLLVCAVWRTTKGALCCGDSGAGACLIPQLYGNVRVIEAAQLGVASTLCASLGVRAQQTLCVSTCLCGVGNLTLHLALLSGGMQTCHCV